MVSGSADHIIICVMQMGKEPVTTQNGDKIQTKLDVLRLLKRGESLSH